MRNLKRALSLTLASVMLLGMMVVGAGAAAFPDVEENHNVEAIEVLKAVNVMIGDDNGNFGPDDPVNRAQMAVVMANLLNLDYNYYEGQSTFKDVPSWAVPYVAACYANGIVSGYNSYTYGSGDGVTAVQAASMMMRALGYFKYTEDYKDGFELVTVRQGTEIGIFDGINAANNAALTRNDVARMALNALESEMVSFTGTPGTTYTSSNGETLSIGYRAEYTPRTSTEIKYQAIEQRTSDVAGGNNLNRGQYYIQLGEELYNGKLTKRFDRDDFMRPSINWQYDGKNIGTYVDYDLLVPGGTYTSEVKYSALYDLLTYTTIRDNDLDRYVDGVDMNESKDNFARSNNTKVGGTGVLTEVFIDQERDEITITSINTYLAKANSDYNKNNETLSLKVYDKNKTGTTYSVDSREVPEAVDAEKGDFMLVYLSGKENPARMDVVNIFDVEIMADSTVTKFSTSDSKVVDKLTTGGTEYKTNPKAFYDKGDDVLGLYDNQLLTDSSYNIYMDRYGNVIGVDLYEGTKNYVFITGFDRGTSHISTKTADAAAIFLDGTMDTITVNVTDTDKNIDRMNGNTNDSGASGDPYFEQWQKTPAGRVSENRWYTYTVASNGIYTLRPVANMFASDYEGGKILNTANLYVDDNGAEDWDVEGWKLNRNDPDDRVQFINKNTVSKGRAYGEDASIYITVESGRVDESQGGAKDAITDVKGVYSGIQDVKMEIAPNVKDEDQIPNRVYTVYDGDHYIIASIVVGDAQGAVANFAYILSDVKSERYEASSSSRANDNGVYYWEFEAFYNGEKTTLTARTNFPSRNYNLNKYTIQELRFDGEYVTDVKDVPASKTHTNNTTNEKIEDMDVYDVGRVIGTQWPDGDDFEHVIGIDGDNLAGNGGASASRLDGTIYLQGRTLYVGSGRSDVGLALAKDAKALLVQSENYAGVETREYNSVEEAVSNIADFNTVASGTQFRGRIAAVLDGRGAAQWVVIISDTELTTGNKPSYGGSEILRWTQNGQYWKLDIPRNEYQDWTSNSTTIIYNWLVKAGCSNVSKTRTGWDFTYKNVAYYDQDVRVNWIYDDVVINSVNPTLPQTDGLKIGDTLPNASAETGANYTVSITWTKDGAAYNNAKVNGAGTYAWTVTLTAKDGYKFATGLKTVFTGSVLVEDEKDPEAVSVNVTSGYVNILKDGKIISQIQDKKVVLTETVKKGDTITVAPAEAVEITSGLAEDGTVNGDITVSPKTGYLWNPFARQWEGPDGTLIGEMIEWPLAPAAAFASRFSILRSVVRSGELEENETDLKWQTDENWFYNAIKNNLKIELRATVDGKDMVMKVVNVDGKWKFDLPSEDKAAFYELADKNPDAVTSVGIGNPNPDKYTVTVNVTPAGAAAVKVNNAEVVADGYNKDTEIVLTVTANKGYKVTAVKVNGTEVTANADGKYEAGKITANMTVEVTAESDAVVPNVYVELSANDVATFTQYVPAGETAKGPLTAAEIEALLKAKTGIDYKVKNGDVTSYEATAEGAPAITFRSATPKQIYLIKYPGGEKLTDSTGVAKVSNITSGVQYLIPSNKIAVAEGSVVRVGAGTTSLSPVGNKDTEYKTAVMLVSGVAAASDAADGKLKDRTNNNTGVIVYIPDGKTSTSVVPLASDTHAYVKEGIKLSIEWFGRAQDTDTVGLSVNGAIAVSVSPDSKYGEYTVANSGTGMLKLEAKAGAVSDNVKVFLDDKEVTTITTDAQGSKYVTLENLGEKHILAKKADGTYTKLSINDNPRPMGKLEVAIKDIPATDTLNEDGTEIRLYTGWSVTASADTLTAGKWVGYLKLEDAKKDGATPNFTNTEAFVADGTTIYVKSNAGQLLAPKAETTATEITELAGRQTIDAKKRANEQSYIYAVNVTKNIAANDIAVFGTFKNSGDWAVSVEDASSGNSTAAASKENVTVDADAGAFFAFENNKGVLDDATTKVTKIVRGAKAVSTQADKLLAAGNTLKTSDITVAKDTTTKTKLDVVIDSTAKRAVAEEVYDVTFEINGVPVVVPVTFAAHTLTNGEKTANVEAVSADAGSVINFTGVDGNGESRGPVSPINIKASGSGTNITLTADAYRADDKDKERLDSWYKDNKGNGAVVAIKVKCPEGAQGVKLGEDKNIDLSQANDGAVDGYLTFVVKIAEDEMGTSTKTFTLTWFTETSCSEEGKMGEAVTYTFDLSEVTWTGSEGA